MIGDPVEFSPIVSSREQRVTAIDRAPLDKRLNKRPGLKFLQSDVVTFTPRKGETYDALLCDMNGPPEESIYHVMRLSRFLKKGGLVFFTLKLPKVDSLPEPCALFDQIVESADRAGLNLFAKTHLTNNRHEFTLFFERG